MLDLTPYRQAIADPDAQDAIDRFENTEDFEAALKDLIDLKAGPSQIMDPTQPHLWTILKKRLQQEICGDDDSIRSLIQSLKKNPGNAALITGTITTLINLAGVPFPIDPALATGITLYLAHISIDVFCEWSSPQE